MTTIQDAPPAPVAPPQGGQKKRRRPSGEPPSLPRDIHTSGKYWLVGVGVALVSWTGLFVISGAGAQATRFDKFLLDPLVSLRTPWLTDVARSLHAFGSEWTILSLRWGIIAVLLAYRRFRHLFVFVGSVLGVGLVTTVLSQTIVRPRPLEITILGHWEGPAHPSRPVAALCVTLMGILYALVVAGRPRQTAKWVAAGLVVTLVFARLYLAVDHPTDVIAAIIIGVSIPLVAFRMLTPNEIFPVSYRGGQTAHLDVDGERGEAICKAVESQMGVTIVDVEPFGLGGSAGSTPLRLTLAGEPPRQLFAKLYASNHLRADRWYKLGRTLLYGRLEDEGSFSTVRRLVQYEDYMIRVMRDAKLPTPRGYGFVEITPEREYLLVSDFVPAAKELLDAEVNPEIIDQSMALVRSLWDAGIAHRDIKPSNILVSGGKVHLIDVAFAEVRPSPWRQAVDLANMMLVLALRSDARTVYATALRYFSPSDIAEAFAATKSVTIPSQIRSQLKQDDRDLLGDFRKLAPDRKPISIQRWSLRRVALTGGVLVTVALGASLAFSNFRGAGLLPPLPAEAEARSSVGQAPDCTEVDELLLVSQSVPSATLLPCVASLAPGWSFAGLDVTDGQTTMFLDSDRAGFRAVHITLTRSCDSEGATEIAYNDEAGTRRLERVILRSDRYSGTRYYLFRGGCVTYAFDFTGPGRTSLADEVSVTMSFISRRELDNVLQRDTGFSL